MKFRIRPQFIAYGSILFALLLVVGVAKAAFSDKGKVLGSTFTVGSSDIKFLANLAQGTEGSNLLDELTGPSFSGIGQNWQSDYVLKLYNNGTSTLALASHAEYLTVNDPDELRSYIYAEVFDWNDTNNNGAVDTDELSTSYGKKTITKWKTEGINLGTIDKDKVKGLVVRFSTETLSDTKQGKSGVFDFIFDAIEATN